MGFTRDFSKKRCSYSYTRLRQIPCGIKRQVRACAIHEISGLVIYNTAYCLGDRLGGFMFVLVNVLVRKDQSYNFELKSMAICSGTTLVELDDSLRAPLKIQSSKQNEARAKNGTAAYN